MTDAKQSGFTLLEVLVSLVVLGFLLAGLSQAIHFGLSATDRQARAIASHEDADAIDRTLRHLVEQADPGRASVGAVFTGTARALDFVSDLTAVAHLATTRQSEVGLSVAAGRLMLRWTPYLHAPRLTPAPKPSQTVLLSGVDHLELAYWGRHGQAERAWTDRWQGPDLPDLVRISLVFAHGDPRRWPPIVVAPMRSKPG